MKRAGSGENERVQRTELKVWSPATWRSENEGGIKERDGRWKEERTEGRKYRRGKGEEGEENEGSDNPTRRHGELLLIRLIVLLLLLLSSPLRSPPSFFSLLLSLRPPCSSPSTFICFLFLLSPRSHSPWKTFYRYHKLSGDCLTFNLSPLSSAWLLIYRSAGILGRPYDTSRSLRCDVAKHGAK